MCLRRWVPWNEPPEPEILSWSRQSPIRAFQSTVAPEFPKRGRAPHHLPAGPGPRQRPTGTGQSRARFKGPIRAYFTRATAGRGRGLLRGGTSASGWDRPVPWRCGSARQPAEPANWNVISDWTSKWSSSHSHVCTRGFRRCTARTLANRRAHPAEACLPFSAGTASSSCSWLIKSHSSRALVPEALSSPQCPLLGEASGHPTGGLVFTASPRLLIRCLESEVLRYHCPVNPVHSPSPPPSRILGHFPRHFWAFEFKSGYIRYFKACTACNYKRVQQLVMFEVQFSLDGIMLFGYSYPG